MEHNNNIAVRVHHDELDYLKAIAAFFVVVGHCLSSLENSVGYVDVLGRLISVIVSSVHVPLFFVIAGFLAHKQKVGVYLRKKFLRLLVPYYTFSFIKILSSLVVDKNMMHGSDFIGVLYDTLVLGGAYWFIYCMLLIYLVAPLIWKREGENSTKFSRRIGIICGILIVFNIINVDFYGSVFPESISFGNRVFATPLFQIERVLMYLPYFAVGMMIQEHAEVIRRFADSFRTVLCLGAFLIAAVLSCLVVFGVTHKGYIVKMWIAISVMTHLYFFVSRLPNQIGWLKKIGEYSLHIMFFDSFFRVALFLVIPRITALNTGVSLCIAMLTVLLSCVSSETIKKLPYINYFFGLGRLSK